MIWVSDNLHNMPDAMREFVALYHKWRQLDADGDYEKALEACEQMIDPRPPGEEPAKSVEEVCREISLLKTEYWAECEAAFQAAAEQSPRSALPWIQRATALLDLGRFEEAMRSLENALLLDPDSADALWRLGHAKSEAGDGRLVDESLRSFDKALELDRRLEAAWYYKAMALSDVHRDEEALACIDELLNHLNPRNHFAWQMRGILLENLRRFREAQACYAHAAEVK